MNQKKKITIIIIPAMILIVLVTIGIIWLNNENRLKEQVDNEKTGENYVISDTDYNQKFNTSSKMAEPKQYQGFEVKNVMITAHENVSNFTGDITNNTGKDVEDLVEFYLVLLNNKGEEISTIRGIVSRIKNGVTTTLLTQTFENIIEAYDYKIISPEEYAQKKK